MTLVICDCCSGLISGELEGPPSGSLAELFRLDPLLEGKVEVSGGCWLWLGASQQGGQNGDGGFYGRISRKGVLWYVHRWAYRLLVGRIPEGHHVHHLCKSTLCLNPAHLDTIDAGEHAWMHNEEDACAAAAEF